MLLNCIVYISFFVSDGGVRNPVRPLERAPGAARPDPSGSRMDDRHGIRWFHRTVDGPVPPTVHALLVADCYLSLLDVGGRHRGQRKGRQIQQMGEILEVVEVRQGLFPLTA